MTLDKKVKLVQLEYRFYKTFTKQYWFTSILLLPFYIYAVFYMLFKARTFMFFTAINPSLRYGGTCTSKFDLLNQVHKKYLPTGVVLPQNTSKALVLAQMQANNLQFPIILKPDIGERGRGVIKINGEQELQPYLDENKKPLILQEFITYKQEFGLMYVRLPNEPQGKITSLAVKNFLYVTGDGYSTLFALMTKNVDCIFYIDYLVADFKHRLYEVIDYLVVVPLLELGICHHGASCVGLNHLITNELNQLFDDVSKTIDRFDVGRYDVKAENYGELLKGNFKVIEINGTDAVPLHIFDKTLMYHSVISDLVKHWQNLLKIAINNHKMGMKYAHFFPVLKEIYQNGSFDKVK